jgi:hypothetical protein
MSNAADIVSQFMRESRKGDFAAARSLLADDFQFKGPFDTFSSPEPYIAALRRLYPIVVNVTIQKLFVDGDEACVLYDMETNTAAGTAFICEWFRIRGNRIAWMQAVFDARPFAPMFSK